MPARIRALASLLAVGAGAGTSIVNAGGGADQQYIIAPVSDVWIMSIIITFNHE